MNNWVMTTVTFKCTDNEKAKAAYENVMKMVDDEGIIEFCWYDIDDDWSRYLAELESTDEKTNSVELYSLDSWPDIGLVEFSKTIPEVEIHIVLSAGCKSFWRRGVRGYIKNGESHLFWLHTEDEMQRMYDETIQMVEKRDATSLS